MAAPQRPAPLAWLTNKNALLRRLVLAEALAPPKALRPPARAPAAPAATPAAAPDATSADTTQPAPKR